MEKRPSKGYGVQATSLVPEKIRLSEQMPDLKAKENEGIERRKKKEKKRKD